MAGLLLVVSTAISHDLLKRTLRPDISEKQELWAARIAASFAVLVAGYFGINPPGFVAQVVAFAFGLAASTFFPAILLGIFTRWADREGVIAGMLLRKDLSNNYAILCPYNIIFSNMLLMTTRNCSMNNVTVSHG